ncbi:hypothetical protein STEG23_016382, partial [Scotinomys teguina]
MFFWIPLPGCSMSSGGYFYLICSSLGILTWSLDFSSSSQHLGSLCSPWLHGCKCQEAKVLSPPVYTMIISFRGSWVSSNLRLLVNGSLGEDNRFRESLM